MIEKIKPLASTYTAANEVTPAQIAEYLFYVTRTLNQIIDKVNTKQRRKKEKVAEIRMPFNDK